MKLVLLLFLCAVIVFEVPFSQVSYGLSSVEELGRGIDLYTQKEPYGGKGLNQSSDAFAPQEDVVLHAYVTYNDDPVANKIVSFEILGPENPLDTIRFTRTAETDGGGLASVSFRIPWPGENPEAIVFGTWSVQAAVEIAEESVGDMLTFEVGWIVEVVKVETVDANNLPKTSFNKGEHMHFRLTVRNIAMVEKVAKFTFNVYDQLDVLLGVTSREDVEIPPDVTAYFIEDLLIPSTAFTGVGVVHANAYDTSGLPWCPQVTTTFSITRLVVHDVAVISVVPSAREVFAGDVINAMVVVRNEGNITETFDVSAYYDSVLIGALPVISLPPGLERTLTFGWSTSGVPEGNYTLSAVASTMPAETDVEDNTFVDGTIWVKSPHAPPVVSEVPVWLGWFTVTLTMLVAATLLISVAMLFYARRRKKTGGPLDLEGNTYRTCVNCRGKFLSVQTFCPHCHTYNG